jgi:hypothetical protein
MKLEKEQPFFSMFIASWWARMKSSPFGLFGAIMGVILFPIAIFVAMSPWFYAKKVTQKGPLSEPEPINNSDTYHTIIDNLPTETAHKSLISEHKQKYLSLEYFEPHWLTREDIKQICEHYQEQNIPIYVQGYCSEHEPKMHATREIDDIQGQIKMGFLPEIVGYIYCGMVIDRGHVEAFLVTKDKIMKPIEWFVPSSDGFNPEDWCMSNKNKSISSTTRIDWFNSTNINLIPQASGRECATLSFAYLKNYLKNDAAQFKEYSMSIPCYNSSGRLRYFFFPSPQVLRYSQSTTFIKCIAAMLNTNEEFTVTHSSGEKIKMDTLEKVLRNSLDKAREIKDQSVIDEITSLLEKLPCYRENWLREFEVIDKRRNAMNAGKYNRWLTYTSQRYHLLAIKKRFSTEIDEALGSTYNIDLIFNKLHKDPEALGLFYRKANLSESDVTKFNENLALEMVFNGMADKFSLFYSLLTTEQKKAFLPQFIIAFFKQIMDNYGNRDDLIDNIFTWLKPLNVKPDELHVTLERFMEKEKISDALKQFCLNFSINRMFSFLGYFQRNEQRLHFLEKYLLVGLSLSDVLKKLYQKHMPRNIELFFTDKALETAFVKEHLPSDKIEEWIKEISITYSMQYTIQHYLDYFSPDEQAIILFKSLNATTLLNMLYSHNIEKYILKYKECPVTKDFISNQLTELKKRINNYSDKDFVKLINSWESNETTSLESTVLTPSL